MHGAVLYSRTSTVRLLIPPSSMVIAETQFFYISNFARRRLSLVGFSKLTTIPSTHEYTVPIIQLLGRRYLHIYNTNI